jgi:hypothetical protein
MAQDYTLFARTDRSLATHSPIFEVTGADGAEYKIEAAKVGRAVSWKGATIELWSDVNQDTILVFEENGRVQLHLAPGTYQWMIEREPNTRDVFNVGIYELAKPQGGHFGSPDGKPVPGRKYVGA